MHVLEKFQKKSFTGSLLTNEGSLLLVEPAEILMQKEPSAISHARNCEQDNFS